MKMVSMVFNVLQSNFVPTFTERKLVRQPRPCHLYHLDPISGKVLRKNRTEKKIPEMTLNEPHVPLILFPNPFATLCDIQIPQTWIANTPPTPSPHHSASFIFTEIPFVKIPIQVMINLAKFFPELSQKIFRHTR